MKKNYLFGLLSLFTLLFAASCQEEELAGGQYGDTATVTFQVNTPTIATRAVGDGTTATKLYVAVYENQNGTTENPIWEGPLPVSMLGEEGYAAAKEFTDRVATVNLALAKNKEYSVIFWAETENNDEAMFDIDWNARQLTLKNELKANQEKYDAFWAQKPVKLTGAISEKVELTRPFAQLNIGTSDKAAAADAGIVVEKSQVIVKDVYSKFDLQTGKATDSKLVTYQMESIDGIMNETFPADKDNQKYLSLNYLLMDTKSTVDVAFSYKDEQDEIPYELNFPSVPVQRNFRTNIYGTLLTNSANYTVEIKPGFGNNGEEDEANIVYVTTQEEFEAALKRNDENIIINLMPTQHKAAATRAAGATEYRIKVGANAEKYYLGGEDTQSITINANGCTINFVHENTDWNYIRCVNDDTKWIINDAHLTNSSGSQNGTRLGNDGPWNRHNIRFYNAVELNNVTSDKAIALLNDGKLEGVKISDEHPKNSQTYGLWIASQGQTVELNNCEIVAHSSKTKDLGITINDQYTYEALAKITLTVKNTKFVTQEGAAIMVESTAGADITLENVDLSGVKADGFHAVWMEKSRAEHFEKVNVTGGFAIVESDIVSEGVSLVEENVYNVWSAKGLSYFSEKNLSGVTLNIINDLDFAGAEFKAIIAACSGELNINGNGNTIKNAKVVSGNGDNTTGQASFFYAFPGSTLKVDNLKFDNVEVDADINGTGYAGVVVGYAEGNVVLNDVDVNKADVYGEKSCGALAGFAPAGSTLSMTDCDVTNSKVEAKEDRTGAYLGRAVGNTAIVTCSVDDNFISIAPDGYANKYIGQRYTSCASLTIDGIEYVDTYYGLDNAVKNMTTSEATFLLAKGTFALPTSFGGKTLNLEGVDKEATILDMTKTGSSLPQYGGTGLSCKNMTVQRALYDYQGFQGQEEHYDNCIISGRLMTYSPLVTANECTFLPGASDDYNVQIYEAGTATFTNCKFNAYKGRSVYAYAESAKEMNLTFTGCEFTSVNGKNENNFAPAIRLHTEYGIHGTLTINNCKNDDNFNTSINGGLWVEWNYGTKKFTNNFVKTINGASFVNADVYTAAQLKDAIGSAQAGDVITLANATYEGEFDLTGKNLTIKSVNENFEPVIKGLVWVDNCTVTLEGLKLTNPNGVQHPNPQNSQYYNTINNQYPLVGAYNNAGIKFVDCTFDIVGPTVYGFYGYAHNSPVFEGCTFNCNKIRPIANNGPALTINGCTFVDQYHYSARIFENSGEKQTIVYTNNTVTGSNDKGEFEGINISKKGNSATVLGEFTIKGNTDVKYRHHKNVTMSADCTYDTDITNFAFEKED